MSEKKIIDSGKPNANEAVKRRREFYITLVVAVLFAVTTYFEYRLSSLSSRLPFVNSIFFFGLINFNIILLCVLVLLISRNVGKLVLERRKKSSGSRLKTKLVAAFLSFTIIPTGILFLISSFYINSSFDKWFSIKILNTLQTSLDITQTYYKNTTKVAQFLSAQIAHEVREKAGPGSLKLAKLKSTLDKTRDRASVDGIELYYDPLDTRLVSFSGEPAQEEKVIPRLPLDVLNRVFNGEIVNLVQHIGGADLIRAVTPVRSWGAAKQGRVTGAIAVTYIIPTSLVNKVDDVSSVFQDYKDVNPLKYPVKTTYFLILVMMTALIVFVSIWIGLYLARELTVPLDRLVTATQKIRTGDLDFEILNTGNDEIARLTDSFNEMTEELKQRRHEIEKSNRELGATTNYIQTILRSITTGVFSIDINGNITTLNPAAEALLDVKNTDAIGQNIETIFSDQRLPILEMYYFLKKNEGQSVQRQFSVGSEENYKTLTATASQFGQGVVFVIDDTSHLTKSQREAAWREVARRIAHEIKNPLTPIKLSAQRLQKRFASVGGQDSTVFKECTDTIIKNVDELRDMVNEFSSFARLPAISPSSHDLNLALKEVLALYAAAHREIDFKFDPEKRMPKVEFDRDQIKRVVINLLDNAVAVAPKNINVETHYNEKLRIAVFEVSDDGPGMDNNVKSRLFEPYFSTKKEGTGLGLAIVKRIVADHSGFIRVVSEPGQGAKFIVELPINSAVEKSSESRVYGEERIDRR
jgi:two-component system nitrogen regulation sensor histidine kinase NtrY